MTKIKMLAGKPRSVPRGGFIILRRDGNTDRLKAANRPYEHATAEAAYAEAEVLAARHGVEFAVFAELAPTASSSKREAGNA